MLKHRAITLERLEKAVSRHEWTHVNLRSTLYADRRAIVDVCVYAASGRVPYDVATAAEYTPCAVGHTFGPSWSTHWFKLRIRLPDERGWEGREVRLIWDSGCEAMVWMDGQALQGLNGSDGDDRRTDFVLTRHSRRGDRWTVYVEAACNGMFGLGDKGMIQPPDMNRTFKLKMVDVALPDADAWGLFYDFTILSDIARHLPDTHPRAARALYTANEMLNVWDRCDRSTWAKARALAQDFLGKRGGEGQHTLFAVGNCHIDTAWLWPYDETKRKVARSFSTALRLMDTYPDYKFCASQAVQFQWLKEGYPELYNRVLQRVKEGRFIPVGGTWVEMDANVPSGESMIRQFVYGQKLFDQEFGFPATEFWLPDTFGYCAQLPQIMEGCGGIKRFLTQKLSWSLMNKFPHTTLWWEGLDGTRVLTHFPPADTYCSKGNVEEVLRSVKSHKDKETGDASLLLYGHGDGGGGPDVSHLEFLTRLKDTDGCPKVHMCAPSEYFARAEQDAQQRPLCVWVGELYLELHQGTFTSQALVKKRNRACEGLLHDIETVGAMLMLLRHDDCGYDHKVVEDLWKLLLLNQFHDVIPGSSIGMVYEDAHRFYSEIESKGRSIFDSQLDTLGGILSTHPEKRKQALEHKSAYGYISATTAVQSRSPTKRSSSSSITDKPNVSSPSSTDSGYVRLNLTGFASGTCTGSGNGFKHVPRSRTVPGLGWALETSEAPASPASLTLSDSHIEMRNTHMCARICTRTGMLTSLLLNGPEGVRREMVEGGRGNCLRLYEDVPFFWDAWDIMPYALEKGKDVGRVEKVEVLSERGERVGVRITHAPLDGQTGSRIAQDVWLYHDSDMLEFDTAVEWHEAHKMLKVEFGLAVRSGHATYETQFGSLTRATHTNTAADVAKWEVCGHRWADLSEPGAGVALLNDCKYGHLCRGSTLALTLLRSPKAPDANCDMGSHLFRYGIFPHWHGPHHQAQVVSRATHFNTTFHRVSLQTNAPPTVAPTSLLWLESDDPAASGVVISTLKSGERSPVIRTHTHAHTHTHSDAHTHTPGVSHALVWDKRSAYGKSVVVRLYESAGGRGRVRLRLQDPGSVVHAVLCDMLESPVADAVPMDPCDIAVEFTPYKIVTVKLVLNA